MLRLSAGSYRQQELDETKIELHKTIESVLQRGERLDDLVDRSANLSMSSKAFYKSAKKQVRFFYGSWIWSYTDADLSRSRIHAARSSPRASAPYFSSSFHLWRLGAPVLVQTYQDALSSFLIDGNPIHGVCMAFSLWLCRARTATGSSRGCAARSEARPWASLLLRSSHRIEVWRVWITILKVSVVTPP